MPYEAPQLRATLQAKDTLGLQPALDRRIVEKPFVVDGQNFLFNVQGPYSGFGRRKISLDPINAPQGAQAFKVSDGTGFIFTREDILKFDFTSQTFYSVYHFTTPVEPGYGWTHCLIAGSDYFCALGPGLLEFNALAHTWTHLTSIYYSTNIVAICECRGRLIVLDEFSYNWSALDDPTDMEPSLTSGAGLQSTAILSGDSFIVMPLDDAFLVYTSNGVIIGEFSGGQAVFRHRVLTNKFKAINPLCVVQMQDDSILFLDKKGFYQTNGKIPQLFDAIFSEYLAETLIRSRDPNNLNSIRLHCDITRKLLIMSVSSTVSVDLFELAWVMYIPKSQWGIFNDYHYGFMGFVLSLNEFNTEFFSVIDQNGFLQRITAENFIDGTLLEDGDIFYRSSGDIEAFENNGIWYFSSYGYLTDYAPWEFEGYGTGWYTLGTSVDTVLEDFLPMEEVSSLTIFNTWMDGFSSAGIEGPVAKELQQDPLNSFILVGMFRYAELKFDDEMGQVTQMSVWSDPAGTQSAEDWMILPNSVEDYLLIDGFEDYGFGTTSTDNFTTILIGTLDGFNIFMSQALENVDQSIQYINRYPCDVTGIFHQVRLEALSSGETFHLKSLEMSGTSAGRLS